MRKISLLLLFILFAARPAAAVDKPLGVEEFSSVEELALSLSSYFPKIQGEVKTVQGDRVTISVPKKDALIPGMVLTLWRDGKEILHPATKTVIGRAEDEVGSVEIATVNEGSVTAVLRKKVKDPLPGDKARITPRKINLAVIPLQEEHPDIIRLLVERLNEYGRFNVLDPAKVDAFVKNSRTLGTATVRELGKAFGLDAVISLGLYPSEGSLMVTARLFYTEDASQLDTLVARLNLKAGTGVLGEVKPFFNPVREEKSVTPELPFIARFLAVGDFEGDGRSEYAFSDGARIHVYRNEPSAWREVWTETLAPGDVMTTMEWRELSAVAEEHSIQHVNLDAADINGNGRPELFVTVLAGSRVFSYVLESRDGSFHRIAEVPGFLRVAALPGKGTVLLGQAYDAAEFASGGIRQYTWSGDAYAAGPEAALPKGIGLYGWTFANVGERAPLLVALDDEDRVSVYSGDSVAWKSVNRYVTVDTFVYRPATGASAALKQTAPTDKSLRVRLRGRVVAADVNTDGKDEILLARNISGTFVGGFTGAELHGLAWNGVRLDPVWSIRDIEGPVFDFRLPLDPAGQRVTALVRTKGGLFTKDRQQVIFYSIRLQ